MMGPMTLPIPASPPSLSAEDEAALTDLYVRGTPANTLRAYERDLIYITAWKAASFGMPPEWPEREEVALRFILDHARSLAGAGDRSGDGPKDSTAETAQQLIALGLRKSLACPAPATLDRRIASWIAFHRMKNMTHPFDAPLLRGARAKARRAAARPRTAKSRHPITRAVLTAMLNTCGWSLRDTRDRAILMLGWASGGRRRSELTALRFADLSLDDYADKGLVWITMTETKTTARGETPQLVLKGKAADAVVTWIETAPIADGFLFRPVSRADDILERGLSPDAIRQIVKRRLKLAGYPADFASPHGLRAGFLTQAALDGAPIQAAMRLSLHRSIAQAQAYYDDVELTDNPATDLLD